MSTPDQTGSWLPREYEPGLVSVVIPTFNRAHLIGDTIRSVFRQTYRPVEIIVSDDGSTDNTSEIIQQLAPPEGVTLTLRSGEKLGSSHARNLGAAESRGEYLMFLDSDDLLTCTALQALVERIAADGADLAWAQWRTMRVLADRCELSRPVTREIGSDWLAATLRARWIATCSILYRRELLCRVPPWDESVSRDADFGFNASVALEGASLAHAKTVASYYRQGGGDQLSTSEPALRARHTRRVLLQIERSLNDRAAWTSERRNAMAYRYFFTAREVWTKTSDRDLFIELVREALRVDPDFRPPNVWYHRIAKVAGYKFAERLADFRRRL